MKKTLAALGMAFALAGCAAAPTQQQINSADYGYSIYQADAEVLVKQFFESVLKDPESAKYRFGEVYRGYMVGSAFEGRKLEAGYLIDVNVNAKNSYGGYTGGKPYKFLIRSGKLIRGFDTSSGVNSPVL